MEVGHGFIVLGKLQEMSGNKKTLPDHLLGTLQAGAPADLIDLRDNPFERFKILEYPDLVVSSGRVIVNKFKK